jgi:L,D-peptidoglycan transpeptidase YkuD (ErfK/YbiS/YcfS/YnhG family)
MGQVTAAPDAGRNEEMNDTSVAGFKTRRWPVLVVLVAVLAIPLADGSAFGSTTSVPATTSTVPATTSTLAPTCPKNLASQVNVPAGTTQLITVEVPSEHATAATLTAWVRSGACWTLALGPYRAIVGYAGIRDHKHEGDDATPAGTFAFGSVIYGNAANPGVKYGYHRLVCGDWWDEVSSSRDYNLFEHVACGADPPFNNGDSEALWTETRSYPSFAVINYNAARTPGRGSAIFLHAYDGKPTHGCVATPIGDLDRVLDWMRPHDSPRIGIGTSRMLKMR